MKMKQKLNLLLLLIALNIFSNDLVVHEWGSIVYVADSKAKTQIGVISEDQSDLPDFVQVWSEQAVQRPVLMKKPILYFYTKKDMFVNVTVNYPKGIFTQWWPNPQSFLPYLPRKGQVAPTANGMLHWRIGLKVDKSLDKAMPVVKNHPWWNIARDVDAATVTSSKLGTEKFLFYRGAGDFTPTLDVVIDKGGKFILKDKAGKKSKSIYTVHKVEGKPSVIHYFDSLSDKKIKFKSTAEASAHIRQQVEARGLYKKEAAGMIKIWEKDMFEKVGQRALYLMEAADIEKLIPLNISPAPKEKKRVMIIRVECLSHEHKQQILALIKQLGAEKSKDRKAAEQKLISTGRVGEAVMREAYKTADDPEVKMRLKSVLDKIVPKR